MSESDRLDLILAEGEGFKSEFKEALSHLDREIVAFANADGGSIFIGISDKNTVIGVDTSNKMKSQIHDIARNCDPSIKITINTFKAQNVLEVVVSEGDDKPYRCKDGFFLRVGPSSQKLKRNEIVELINHAGKIRFDEAINDRFDFKKDFSSQRLDDYLKCCGIDIKSKQKDILLSLNVAVEQQGSLHMTNAGVIFFAKHPQRFFPESYITCVKYNTPDRYAIIDNKDFTGSPIEQIEQALAFTTRHTSTEQRVGDSRTLLLGQHSEVSEYPLSARREAIINAVVHRDYFYDSSHIYIHMFPSYMDIENPGGLPRGMSVDLLGERSVRRNRLIADLLHRAGYINRVGSGFDRIKRSLEENANPPYEISSTNFFNIRFHKRQESQVQPKLTQRQWQLLIALQDSGELQKSSAARVLGVSDDTALRELTVLVEAGLAQRVGSGRATKYVPKL